MNASTADRLAYACPAWCTAAHPRTGSYDPYAIAGVPLHTATIGEVAGQPVALAWSDADLGAPIVTAGGLELEPDQALALAGLLVRAARLASTGGEPPW